MSFFKRIFGKSEGAETNDIDAQLAALEADAADARPGYVGSAFNKAGDLALKSGRRDKAVGYYGQAIDAFLEDAQREQARSVANKIIRVRPTAVRTLCTLTWLDLSARHPAMALLHLRDYVEAASNAEQQPRAATQIYLMARSSPDSEFIGAVADGLDQLNFPKRAAEVRSWAGEGAPDAIADPDELSASCLDAAVHSNDSEIELLQDDPFAESLEDSETDDEAVVGAEEPDTEAEPPDADTDDVEAGAEEPEAEVDEPEVDAEEPEAEVDEPEVDAEEPEAEVDEGEAEADESEAADAEPRSEDVDADEPGVDDVEPQAEAEAAASDPEASDADASAEAEDGVESDDGSEEGADSEGEPQADTEAPAAAHAEGQRSSGSRKKRKKKKKKKKR